MAGEGFERRHFSRGLERMSKVRLNLLLAAPLAASLEEIADEKGVTLSELLRESLALYIACHRRVRAGMHLGIVADVSRLDTVIIGLS